jgi:hypothetical protein
LIHGRLHARDTAMQLLDTDLRAAENLHSDPHCRISHHIDRSLSAQRKIDRLFWLHAAANAITLAASDDHSRADLLRFALVRLNLSHTWSHWDRIHAIRLLSRLVLPVS